MTRKHEVLGGLFFASLELKLGAKALLNEAVLYVVPKGRRTNEMN